LVAIDGSDYTEAVLQELLARRFPQGTSFRLIHVLNPFDPIEPSPVTPLDEWANWVKDIRNQKKILAQKMLLKAAETIRQDFFEAEIVTDLCESYMPDEIILDVARTWGADLVIVGSRGVSSLERFLLGSVSNSVLLNAPCSVEIVKLQNQHIGSSKKIKNILLALDISTYSDAALARTMNQEWSENTKIKIISVVKPAIELFGLDITGLLSANIAKEHELTVQTRSNWLEKKTEQAFKTFNRDRVSIEVLTGDAREVILNVAAELSSDLIVMGSHSRRGVSKILLGSVSQAVALHSTCSVLVVKAPESLKS